MPFESLTREITTIDDFGFEYRPRYHWLPESPEDEIKRLEMNQAIYSELINLGTRFPPKVNQERMDEYLRIKKLGGQYRVRQGF